MNWSDRLKNVHRRSLRSTEKKLEGKVKELLEDTQIDEGRIASEIVIFADKICTDEEVVRLRSHVEHMKQPFSLMTVESDVSLISLHRR